MERQDKSRGDAQVKGVPARAAKSEFSRGRLDDFTSAWLAA